MSSLVVAATTIFTSVSSAVSGAVATGGFLSGVLGTAVKGAFVGGIVSKATGGSFGKGFLLGGLGGAALGGLGGLGGGAEAIGSSVGGGTSGASGGLFSGGFLGQVLSGAASSWAEGAAMKEREQQQIDEEERREDRYAGVGDALSPFTDDSPVGLDGGFATQAATGGAPMVDERAVDRGVLSAGDEYQRKVEMENSAQRRRKARYNPDTGRIEYEEAAA